VAANLVGKRQRLAQSAIAGATALLDAANGLTFTDKEQNELSVGFQDSDFTLAGIDHTTKETVDVILSVLTPALNAWLDAPIDGGAGAPRRAYFTQIRK
jgi:hypothetical protein